MIIKCGKTQVSTINVPPGQLVKRIGKYLKKTISGAYNYVIGANECSLKLIVYYQVPYLPDKPGGEMTYSDLKEMEFDLSLATYSNKIRVNLIEISPEEKTLGHFVLPPEKLYDMIEARKIILDKVTKILNKTFEGYEFIF